MVYSITELPSDKTEQNQNFTKSLVATAQLLETQVPGIKDSKGAAARGKATGSSLNFLPTVQMRRNGAFSPRGLAEEPKPVEADSTSLDLQPPDLGQLI